MKEGRSSFCFFFFSREKKKKAGLCAAARFGAQPPQSGGSWRGDGRQPQISPGSPPFPTTQKSEKEL